jgi:hypothetical protein
MMLPVVQDRTQAPQIVRQHLYRPLETRGRQITLARKSLGNSGKTGPHTGEVPIGQLDTVQNSLRYVCGRSSHQICLQAAPRLSTPRRE